MVYEQIRKELETFLTSLRSLSSLESISRIQEALEGKKRGGREPDGREMAVKKLIILKETLTKLEETMKTEGFERENIKNDRQYETSTEELQKTQTILNRQETRQIYAETLEQIRRIVGGFKIEEKSGGDASKTRKIRTQQKTLLELLRSSEVVIRTEADKRLETMHIPKEFYEKRREIVRNYLHIIGERHISEERMMRGDVRESMRIHRETAAERQKLVEIHRTSEVQKTSGDRKVQMYHKPSETFDREMVMEEIQKQRTRTLRQDAENIHITSQSHTQKNFTERQTQVQTDSLVKKSTENINEMIQKGVQRGVQRQIDNISNQVYHKLERKLSDDRKRRGH